MGINLFSIFGPYKWLYYFLSQLYERADIDVYIY